MAVLIAMLAAGCAPRGLGVLLLNPSEKLEVEGNRLVQEDRITEGLLAYRAAVEKDAKNESALRKLAEAYVAQGRTRLAKRYYQQAAALNPADAALQQALQTLPKSDYTAADLKPAWRVQLPGEAVSGLAVEGELLIAALENGTLSGLDAANGSTRWQVNLPSMATSAPVVINGNAFIGGQDGTLHVYSALDGGAVWQFQTDAPIYAPVTGGENGQIYLPSGDGTLYALDGVTGRLLWKFKTGGALHGQVTAASGRLYFGSGDARLYALDAATGAPVWLNGILVQGMIETRPVVLDGRVIFGCADSRIYALDAKTGGEYWRYSTPDAIYADPLVVDGSILAASFGQVLARLDFVTGMPIFEIDTPAPVQFSPVIVGGEVLVIGVGDPTLYAYDLQTGKTVWQVNSGDWFSAAPLTAGGAVYLAGKDGSIIKLESVK